MRKSRNLGWALAATLLATGCMGPFNMTRQLHHWHGTVTDNKWANETLFFITWPAYIVTTFADSMIFNSVEFWSGKNWVSAPGLDLR